MKQGSLENITPQLLKWLKDWHVIINLLILIVHVNSLSSWTEQSFRSHLQLLLHCLLLSTLFKTTPRSSLKLTSDVDWSNPFHLAATSRGSSSNRRESAALSLRISRNSPSSSTSSSSPASAALSLRISWNSPSSSASSSSSALGGSSRVLAVLGSVFGETETGRIVTLKKVKFDNFEPESVRFMAREILILKRLNHPNVIKLQGLVTSKLYCNIHLVFEYMEHDLTGLLSDVNFTTPQVSFDYILVLRDFFFVVQIMTVALAFAEQMLYETTAVWTWSLPRTRCDAPGQQGFESSGEQWMSLKGCWLWAS